MLGISAMQLIMGKPDPLTMRGQQALKCGENKDYKGCEALNKFLSEQRLCTYIYAQLNAGAEGLQDSPIVDFSFKISVPNEIRLGKAYSDCVDQWMKSFQHAHIVNGKNCSQIWYDEKPDNSGSSKSSHFNYRIIRMRISDGTVRLEDVYASNHNPQ